MIIKQIVIYGQSSEPVVEIIENMKLYALNSNWSVVAEIIDFEGSSIGLEELSQKLDNIDMIFVYSRNHVTDEFNWEFLNQLIRNEEIELKFYC